MDKHAYEASVMMVLEKRASAVQEVGGSIITGLANPLTNGATSPIGLGGEVAALVDPADNDPRKALEELNESDVKSLLPGLSSYRLGRRMINTNKLYGSERPREREVTRKLLGVLSIGLPTAIGVGLGATVGNAGGVEGKLIGGLIGGGIGLAGSGLAHLIGAVAAGVSKRRTDEEQRQATTASNAKFLIPGYATYDAWKTIGKSRDIVKKDKEDPQSEDKDE